MQESKRKPFGFVAKPTDRTELEARNERASIANDTPSYRRDESNTIARLQRQNRYGR